MKKEASDLFVSFTSLIVTIFISSQLILTNTVMPRLYDATVNELGRYSFTFDAYEFIENDEQPSVIAIGSSKMREIFDGIEIKNQTAYDAMYYNLAYAGDRPYVRMVEIDAIIKSNPDLVIIEYGPNYLSKLSSPLSDTISHRMSHLISINSEWHSPSWLEMVDDDDLPYLPLDRISQLEYIQTLTPVSVEKTILYGIDYEDPPYDCKRESNNVRCVPYVNDADYLEYLQYPTQFGNALERIKGGYRTTTIEEFYGPMLDDYINRSYHNPEGIFNKNVQSLEFMIDSLISNEIEVLLVGLPYNPVLIDRLAEGQWEYYNTTYDYFKSTKSIHTVDFLWTDYWYEEDFNDYTHASRAGEIKFSKLISKEIDYIMLE